MMYGVRGDAVSWIDRNGVAIESPRGDHEPENIHEIRATVIFWDYMNKAGMSFREIATCFDVDHKLVMAYIKSMPDEIREEYESSDFVGRLRAAFPEGRRPKSYADVRAVMQAAVAS